MYFSQRKTRKFISIARLCVRIILNALLLLLLLLSYYVLFEVSLLKNHKRLKLFFLSTFFAFLTTFAFSPPADASFPSLPLLPFSFPDSDNEFPSFRDFDVCHHYLQTASRMLQSRLRKRGCNGKWSYTHTIRKVVSGQTIEVKTPLNHRDYSNLISQEDPNHFLIYKTRRCFLWENQYFQLDIYREPSHDRCKGLMLLETYTTKMGEDLQRRLPPFLNVGSGSEFVHSEHQDLKSL